MPQARNDPYKRKAAQAVNHLAAAILDIHEIYLPFEQQFNMLKEQAEQYKQSAKNMEVEKFPADEVEAERSIARQKTNDQERYARYVNDLYQVMMGISATREHILIFAGEVWNLDEESIKVYMG